MKVNKADNLKLLKNNIIRKKPFPFFSYNVCFTSGADGFARESIDIASKGPYPANILSNFTPCKLVFDGIQINSIEGFLQSLKTKKADLQQRICLLVGIEAKEAGNQLKESHEFDGITLTWNGQEIDRNSDEYQELLRRIFNARFDNDLQFRNALIATDGKILVHSIGKSDPAETILTEEEFITILDELRANQLGMVVPEKPKNKT